MRLGSELTVRNTTIGHGTTVLRGAGAVILLAIAGCAPPPAPEAAAPLNPFGYLQPASVCKVPTIRLPASGTATAAMTVSNDGYCAIHLAKPEGGPFASFLVTAAPSHGLPLNYNYNERSVITYTATSGYVGPDHMTIELVSGQGMPRTTLSVDVTVVPSGTTASPARPRTS